MARTRRCVVGKEVYDKLSGRMGRVLREDGFRIVVRLGSTPEDAEIKSVSSGVFQRFYKVIEDPDAPETPKVEQKRIEKYPKGRKGVGERLYLLFRQEILNMANQDLEFYRSADGEYEMVRYNGHNVFRTRTAKRRLVVYCHPKSLCPANKARIVKQYPKEYHWVLCAKFVFSDDSDLPLMRSIIADGLFYRQIIIRDDEDD